jgi:AAA domain
VIAQAYLNEWASQAPWPQQAQVEQDLVLSRLIVEIARHDLLGGELTFRGGTCLALVIGHTDRWLHETDAVDQVQGQEAAVCFFSMATSSGEEIPRNLEFLFSRNRLNVAVSRARCLGVLVCNPALLEIRCRDAEQMRLLNSLCLFVEMGGGADMTVHQGHLQDMVVRA